MSSFAFSQKKTQERFLGLFFIEESTKKDFKLKYLNVVHVVISTRINVLFKVLHGEKFLLKETKNLKLEKLKENKQSRRQRRRNARVSKLRRQARSLRHKQRLRLLKM